MVYMGTAVSEEFYEKVKETADLEERNIASFVRLAVRDRVRLVRHQLGVDN